MTQAINVAQELPGKSVNFGISLPKDSSGEKNIAKSAVLPFEQVKHLLSEKPLRRPNRTRPLP